jgi:hypothetical protein
MPTECDPAVDGGTANVAVKPPESSEVIVAGVVVTGVPLYVIVIAELAAKLEPVTVMEVPVGPELGLRVAEGARPTVKVAVALVDPLEAHTVEGPAVDDEGTVKVAEKVPVEVLVMVAGVVVTLVPLSLTVTVEDDGKWEPATVTWVPGGPEVGDSVMEGGDITVNVAVLVAAPLVAFTV